MRDIPSTTMTAFSYAVLLMAALVGAATAGAPASSKGKNVYAASPDDGPRQALHKLVAAIKAGDSAAVRTYMAIDPSNDPAYADNWAAILASQGRLKRVIGEKLGPAALRRWEKEMEEEEKRFSVDVMVKEIEAAEPRQGADGALELGPFDTARGVLGYPSNYIRLGRVGRVWKIDLQDWTGLQRGDKSKRFSPKTFGEMHQIFGDGLNAIADQMEQGKIKTYEDFSREMRWLSGTESRPQPPTRPRQTEGVK